ncbi:hypothetical protein DSM112329_03391 [Paraconexibacter sp. AEG42_29]|uniref:MucB/RseB N-terminal domain-containing protein n=1 Tax=Paraconexibacter sp. AEG42_29 TaxID=2997339 RepID=A0AAU7AXS7_9ACTN
MPRADDMLRELRPTEDAASHDPAGPAATATLERILSGPQPAPRAARRPPVRRVLAGGLAAVAVAGAVVLVPVGGDSPDVLARAATALNDGDAILHVKAVRRGMFDNPDLTEESWQTTDGRQVRTLYESGKEVVQDWDTRTNLSYSTDRDTVTRHTDPDLFPPGGPKSVDNNPTPLGFDALGDLQGLLERARRGDGSVRLLDDTQIDGRPVHQIEISYPVRLQMPPAGGGGDPKDWPSRTVSFSRLVFVDREDFLPVRVVERTPPSISLVIDFIEAERLPRTPETEAKLRFAPHPGARQVVEGDIAEFG